MQFAQQREAARKAFAGYVLEVIVERIPWGHIELWKWLAHLFQFDIAALSDLHGARQHTLVAGEDLCHFGRTLHEKLIVGEFQPVGIVDRLAGLDADHHILRVSVVFAQVMAVVGGDQWDIQLLLQLQQIGLDALLFRQSLVLDF